MDAIAEAAHVTKKTLYDRFGSKDRLIAAYLERRNRIWHDSWTSNSRLGSRRRRKR